jgi:hypothetical protein
MSQESKSTYIDITPTWSGLLPSFIEWIVSGNDEQKKLARSELKKIAALADAYVALNKKEN